jgi:hypothetical protein
MNAMKNVPVPRTTDEELAACRREVAKVSEQLADNEVKLATLKADLAKFQYRYFQAIGRKYVELDELRARLARRRAERMPQDEQSAFAARRQRFEADRSAGAYRHFRRDEPVAAGGSRQDVSREAKKLFREIAVQIHPDRAENEKARALRTALMAELNAAYAASDIERMQTVLDEWRTSPESVTGENAAAELQRLAKTIARLRRRLERMERETERLQTSTLGRLLRRAREASLLGRDLLDDLAAEIELKIALVRRELEMEELLKRHERHR